MNELADIQVRRARLLAQAEAQRQAIAAGFAACRGPLSLAERGIACFQWLRPRPYVLAVAAGLVFAARPARALGWVSRGLALWRISRTIVQTVRALTARSTAP